MLKYDDILCCQTLWENRHSQNAGGNTKWYMPLEGNLKISIKITNALFFNPLLELTQIPFHMNPMANILGYHCNITCSNIKLDTDQESFNKELLNINYGTYIQQHAMQLLKKQTSKQKG